LKSSIYYNIEKYIPLKTCCNQQVVHLKNLHFKVWNKQNNNSVKKSNKDLKKWKNINILNKKSIKIITYFIHSQMLIIFPKLWLHKISSGLKIINLKKVLINLKNKTPHLKPEYGMYKKKIEKWIDKYKHGVLKRHLQTLPVSLI
jgi:hypothetical protein